MPEIKSMCQPHYISLKISPTDPVAQNALGVYSILHCDHTHPINYESVQRSQRGRIA